MCGSTAIDGASGGGGGNGAIGVAGGNADRIANRSPIELNASLTQTITGGDGGRKGNGAGGGVSGIGGMVALGGLEQMDQAEVVELEEMPLVFFMDLFVSRTRPRQKIDGESRHSGDEAYGIFAININNTPILDAVELIQTINGGSSSEKNHRCGEEADLAINSSQKANPSVSGGTLDQAAAIDRSGKQ